MSSGESDLVKVEPVQKVESRGNIHKYRYTFSEVHIGEAKDNLDSIFHAGESEAWVEDGNIHYQYADKVEIVLKDDGAYVDEEVDRGRGERQAYYALSIMAGSGYVSNWRKQ